LVKVRLLKVLRSTAKGNVPLVPLHQETRASL